MKGNLTTRQDDSVKPELVEAHEGIKVLRGGGKDHRRSWNGIRYRQGISGRNVGARNLSINVAAVPPGGIAYAHIHGGFEVMLYIVEGKVRHDIFKEVITLLVLIIFLLVRPRGLLGSWAVQKV